MLHVKQDLLISVAVFILTATRSPSIFHGIFIGQPKRMRIVQGMVPRAFWGVKVIHHFAQGRLFFIPHRPGAKLHGPAMEILRPLRQQPF